MDEENKQSAENEGRWKRLKQNAKDSYQSTKKKIAIKKQEWEEEKNKKELNQKFSQQYASGIPNLNPYSNRRISTIHCKICNSPIAEELIEAISKGKQVICESCGSILSASDFIKQ